MGFVRYSRRTLAFLLFAACLAPIAGSASDAVIIEIAESSVVYDARTGEPVISIRMTKASQDAFAKFTAAHIGDNTEFRLGTQLLSAAVVREPIAGGVFQISGKFSRDEAMAIAKQLPAGAKIDVSVASK